MLMKIWRKGNPPALPLEMKICTATMEKIMDSSQKLKLVLPYDPAVPLLRLYLKKMKTLMKKDTRTQCS